MGQDTSCPLNTRISLIARISSVSIRNGQHLTGTHGSFCKSFLPIMFCCGGDRGTGKSSLVKAMLGRYADKGLRLVGIGKEGLVHLQEIAEMLWERPERYILFCDDLAFNEDEPEYRELKAMLEGGISACPDNVLIYATSNRRHLMPRQVGENQYPQNDEDELYPTRGNRGESFIERPFRVTSRFLPDFARYLFADRIPLRTKTGTLCADRNVTPSSIRMGSILKRTVRTRRLSVCYRSHWTIITRIKCKVVSTLRVP